MIETIELFGGIGTTNMAFSKIFGKTQFTEQTSVLVTFREFAVRTLILLITEEIFI